MAKEKSGKGGALQIPGTQKADISKKILGAGFGILVLCIVMGLLDFLSESSDGRSGVASWCCA
jgi:hypothetical protein